MNLTKLSEKQAGKRPANDAIPIESFDAQNSIITASCQSQSPSQQNKMAIPRHPTQAPRQQKRARGRPKKVAHIQEVSHVYEKEKEIVNKSPLKEFQTATNIKHDDKLQEFESLVPVIVDSHKKIAIELSTIQKTLVQNHQSNQEHFTKITSKLEKMEAMLEKNTQAANNLTAMMHCIASQQQVLIAMISHQQYLASTIPPPPLTNNPSSSTATPPSYPTYTVPMNYHHPPIRIQPLVAQPVAIQPSLNTNSQTASKSEKKKKKKWVSYNP